MTFSRKAEYDLDDIADYYEEHGGIDVAKMVVSKIIKDANRLARFPRMGTIRPDIECAAGEIRVMMSNPYLIIYVHDEDEVMILRVFHGRRDVTEMRV